MTLLQTLAARSGRWQGRGINHEQEAFTGTLQIEPLVGGAAVLLRYRATLDDGSVAHEEASLLAPGPDGVACLWPVMSELPVVLPHVRQPPHDDAMRGVFASGPRDDAEAFREEITLAFEPGGTLWFAHAWGLPGGAFADRSWCRLSPAATGA